MYYGIVMVAVLMFSLQFLFNQQFEKECGSSLRASAVFSLGTNAAGTVILLLINGLQPIFTPFGLFMAVLVTVNSLLYTICSMKALGKINLSVYSVFAMLGGMVLPFLAGILFFEEALTLGKVICFITVGVSLFFTVEKGRGKGGFWYYAGVFVLNGMSGVLAKIYQAADFAKTGEAGYSVLCSLCATVISLVFLFCVGGNRIKLTLKSGFQMLGYGALCKVGNFLLLIALAHLPASAQYPLVTGGVMVFSVIISLFTPDKPKKKDIAAVVLSLAGIMALVLLP